VNFRCKEYTLEGQFIREKDLFDNKHAFTGIVVYHSGNKTWFCNSLIHRIDGPAIEDTDGTKLWYVHGKRVTKLEHKLFCDIMKLKGLL